jgi:hypothetical protein
LGFGPILTPIVLVIAIWNLLVKCICIPNKEDFKKNIKKLETPWAEPVLLTCHFVFRKLDTEPSICASYQISINLAKRF